MIKTINRWACTDLVNLSRQLDALVVPRKGVKSGKGQRKANIANRWR